MWLIIGVIVLVLATSIVDFSSNRMNYSDLINKIETGEVKEIKIDNGGEKAEVTLKNDTNKKEVIIPNEENFMNYVQDHITTDGITLSKDSQSMLLPILAFCLHLD